MNMIVTITVNFNSRPALDTALESSMAQETSEEHCIVVWENGRDREICGIGLGESCEVNGKLLHYIGIGKNLGYAPAVQKSWQWVLTQDWSPRISQIHLATPDAYAISTNVLSTLCAQATRSNSIVGPAMRDGKDAIRLSAYPFMRPYNVPLRYLCNGWMTRLSKLRDSQPASGFVETLDGAYVVFPRGVWDVLGGLDQNYFLYTDDHDVCRRAHELGIRRWRERSVEVTHEGGLSRVSRRFLCQLERVRCSLRYVETHFGRTRAEAVRRTLAIELSPRWGWPRGLSWWSRECPTSFSEYETVTSIEDQYLNWLTQHDDAEAGLLRSALDREVGR